MNGESTISTPVATVASATGTRFLLTTGQPCAEVPVFNGPFVGQQAAMAMAVCAHLDQVKLTEPQEWCHPGAGARLKPSSVRLKGLTCD
jgi:hypothetical protein